MTRNPTIRPAELPRDLPAVQELCWEYRDFLIGFGPAERSLTETFYPVPAYRALLERLAERHARPGGIILLAEAAGAAAGCGMLQPFGPGAAEAKRIFVRPAARGLGIGRALTRALIDQARSDGYGTLYLDTSRNFAAARRLYESLGFRERGPYAEVPETARAGMSFYELTL